MSYGIRIGTQAPFAEGQTIVEALDPQAMVTITGRPALQPVADEAAVRLRTALESLRESRGTR